MQTKFSPTWKELFQKATKWGLGIAETKFCFSFISRKDCCWIPYPHGIYYNTFRHNTCFFGQGFGREERGGTGGADIKVFFLSPFAWANVTSPSHRPTHPCHCLTLQLQHQVFPLAGKRRREEGSTNHMSSPLMLHTYLAAGTVHAVYSLRRSISSQRNEKRVEKYRETTGPPTCKKTNRICVKTGRILCVLFFSLSLSLSHGVIRLTYTKTASKVFSCNFLFLRTHTENAAVPACTIFVLQTEQIMSFLYFCWDDPRFEDSKSPLNKSKHVNFF